MIFRKFSLTSSSTIKVKYLTGMKPNSDPHIGHYYGVIKNLLDLQTKVDISDSETNFLFIPDLHSLTATYFANNDE